jgi:hypothetical protein
MLDSRSSHHRTIAVQRRAAETLRRRAIAFESHRIIAGVKRRGAETQRRNAIAPSQRCKHEDKQVDSQQSTVNSSSHHRIAETADSADRRRWSHRTRNPSCGTPLVPAHDPQPASNENRVTRNECQASLPAPRTVGIRIGPDPVSSPDPDGSRMPSHHRRRGRRRHKPPRTLGVQASSSAMNCELLTLDS